MKWYQRPPTIEELRERAHAELEANPTIVGYSYWESPLYRLERMLRQIVQKFEQLGVLPWDLPDDPFDPSEWFGTVNSSEWWDLPRPDRDLEDWLPRPAQ